MAIIALSGYAGAGKDLVGQFIQLLNSPDEIQQGTNIDRLTNIDDWWLEEQSGWEIKKFAGKLKTIASMLTGIPVEKFENQEFKTTTLGEEWDFADADDQANIMTVRMFLQKLGTDGLRNGLHTNTWVNALFADYVYNMSGYSDRMTVLDMDELYPNWIITDCRFPNEAEAVHKRGGIILRINRPGITAVNAHPSETSLDDWKFDGIITNDGSKQDLFNQVKFHLEKQFVC